MGGGGNLFLEMVLIQREIWADFSGHNSVFEIVEQQNEDHFVRLLLFDKICETRWNLIVVYGAAQIEQKEKFLTELSQVCQKSDYPLLVGVTSI